MEFMIFRFEAAAIFGQPEEYEEHSSRHSCERRLKWLENRDDGFTYWAEDSNGNVFNAEEISY